MSTDQTHPQAGSLFDRQMARIAVGAYDDAQDVRTATMNRIRDIVRKRNEGIPFDETEEEKEDGDYESKYQDENLPDLVADMREDGKLTPREFEYLDEMLETAAVASEVEDRYKGIMEITEEEPVYSKWLTHVYGISTTLTARLIHKYGYCEDFDRVSQMWSYSGLAPGQERVRGEQLGYDPDAKTLAWLIADRMVMQGERSRYRTEFYDPYKQEQLRRMERAEDMTEAQLEQVNWTPAESKGHADARARRYLAKKVLKHYWAISRDLAGLDTPDEYIIAHGGHEKREDTWENPFYALRQLRQEP